MPPRRLSMYAFSEGLRDEEGRVYLTEPEPFPYEAFDDNREHLVSEGETLFSLAGRYFRNFPRSAGLYWVIGHFQPEPIHDPTIRLEAGTVLVIPSERVVEERIFSERRRVQR